ncbi:cadherin-like beta sandwich domain-containing protein [Acholeplasma vituli]|uniref:Cadherin-like beta sandwich domain-containing protein n=1 Tax=Paracholeplasma vituli TaxID=69473 RepID=A0ABT2PUK4_9MOLU|nr:cadherin-like beta sandwich domain-containing protein [Paracholeplasma vituli]MCU0104631.1 cadherin-like beta sandwich domain-containing protein [Paracholeplasma vituli]
MKKTFILGIMILLGALLLIKPSQEVQASNPSTISFSMVESTTGKSRLTLAELKSAVVNTYISFDIVATAIGEPRKMSAFAGNVVWTNNKFLYNKIESAKDQYYDADFEENHDVNLWKDPFFTAQSDNASGHKVGFVGAIYSPVSPTFPDVPGYGLSETISTSGTKILKVTFRITNTNLNSLTTSDVIDFSFVMDEADSNHTAYDIISKYEYPKTTMSFSGFVTGEPITEKSADLTGISLKGIGNTEYISGFSTSTITYNPTLSYQDSLDDLTLLTTKASSTAVVDIKKNGVSMVGSTVVGPFEHNDIITVSVTDDDLTKDYIIQVAVLPPSTNNNLASLTTSSGSLSPVFAQGTTSYVLDLPYAITSTTLSATLSDSKASLKINNIVRSSLSLSNIAVGDTIVTFSVTSESLVTKIYTVTVRRQVPSSNTDLTWLNVNGENVYLDGETSFSKTLLETQTSFQLNIKPEETTVKKIEYSTNGGTSYNTIGQAVNSTSFTVSKGQQITFSIRVTAQDDTIQIYQLLVERPLSSNTEIKTLTVKEGQTTYEIAKVGSVYTYTLKDALSKELLLDVIGKETGTTFEVYKDGTLIDPLVSIDGILAGTHTYTIKVIAANGVSYTEYTFNIIKKSSEKDIIDLKLYDVGDNYADLGGLTFNSITQTYSASLPFSIKQIQLVLTASEKALITRISGITINNGGQNTINAVHNYTLFTAEMAQLVVRVTAEDGSIAEYTFTITRAAASTERSLDEFAINGQTVDGFIPGQPPISGGYGTIVLPGTTTSITVDAVAKSTLATITYNGSDNPNINLVRGVKQTITVRVTAESGMYYEYKVDVIAANTDNTISNIIIRDANGQPLALSFAPETTTYTLSVHFAISIVNIQVTTPNLSYSVVTTGADNSGNRLINTGYNKIVIFATSEAGTKGVEYTVEITRNAARTDNNLTSLTISSSGASNHGLTPNFIASQTNYDLRVDDIISGVTVSASVNPDNGASIISGNGYHPLTSGQITPIQIVVESEAGVRKTYTVNVKRANNDYALSQITIAGQTYLVSSFDINQVLQLSTAPYSDKSYLVNIILNDPNASYTVSSNYAQGVWTLSDNINELVINVRAQDGTLNPKPYIIRINRTPADVTKTLSNLEVKVGSGANMLLGFNESIFGYTLRVDRSVTNVSITPTLKSNKSTYEISPDLSTPLNLTPSNQTLYRIRVYNEAKTDFTDYTVTIIRADDTHQITGITANRGNAFTFNATTLTYDLGTVPFIIKDITFNITKPSTASIKINGYEMTFPYKLTLEQGKNVFEIQAFSEYGNSGDIYVFEIIQQAPSTDAGLVDLLVKTGSTILINEATPIANNIYKVRVDNPISFVDITYAKSNVNALVSISPNNGGTLNLGVNSFTIVVTAEDGITVKYYRIEITRGNDNNDFHDVTIDGVPLVDISTYDSLTNTYTLNSAFPFDKTTILIDAVLEDSFASLYGIGSKNLNFGTNTYSIYAVSEVGTKSTVLNIKVNRTNPNTDSKLDGLSVQGLAFDGVVFDPYLTTYTITLPTSDTRTQIQILATVNAVPGNMKKISGDVGIKTLPTTSGFSVQYVITVTAEDQSTTQYTINVLKNTTVSTDASLDSVEIDGVSIPYSSFTGNILELDPVLFSKKNIEITVKPTSDKATVSGQQGIRTLVNGINSFKFKVIAQDGVTGSTVEYEIRFVRLTASTDDTLKSLNLIHNGQSILTGFNPLTNSYTLSIDRSNPEIDLQFEVNHLGQRVTGNTGIQTLIPGIDNVLKVFVESESGSIRTYTIIVSVKDTDNTIEEIHIDGIDRLSDFNNQSLDLGSVAYAINQIQISALSGTYAVITGNGTFNLSVGFNTLKVYATSESGVKGTVFTITITRNPMDSNNKIDDLYVTDGLNTLPFDEGAFVSTTKQYTITLPKSNTLTKVTVVATPNNPNYIPTGVGEKVLQVISGVVNQTLTVSVQSEDGQVNTYTINIIREANPILSSDYQIKDAQILGKSVNYLLTFNTNVAKQTAITVPFNVDVVQLALTIADKATLVDNNNFKNYNITPGQTITITFQVRAENGDLGLRYEMDVTREVGSSNNTLEALTIEIDGVLMTLDPSKLTQRVTVGSNANLIKLDGQIPATASVIGFGEYSVNDSPFVITVTAENGEKKNYIVQIDVLDENNTVSEIRVDGIDKLADFTNEMLIVNVPFSKTTLDIVAIPESVKAVITGNGQKTLVVGVNTFKVYATSQMGLKGLEYTLIINRANPDSNHAFTQIKVTDGNETLPFVEGLFTPLTKSYHVVLSPESNLTAIVIEASPSNPLYSVTGVGVKTLQIVKGVIQMEFVVSITAENGDINSYTIYVDKEAKPLQSDTEIQSVSLIGNGFNYLSDFDPLKALQNKITLPYGTNAVQLIVGLPIGATLVDQNNLRMIYFTPGQIQTIEFQVRAENGNLGLRYQVEVERSLPRIENTLESLYVIIEGVKTDLDVNKLIHTLTTSSLSSITIGGDIPEGAVVAGFGTFGIKQGPFVISVMAENGQTKNYIITMNVQDDNALMKEIQIDSVNRIGEFINDKLTLVVPYEKTSIKMNGIAESLEATVTGNGTFNLNVGLNAFTLYVTAESGLEGTYYVVEITREHADNNAYLKSLIVKDVLTNTILDYAPVFNKTGLYYALDLTALPSVGEIEILAEADSLKSVVTGTGIYTLKTQTGVSTERFTVSVKAEDGTTLTYELVVTRNVLPEDDVTITNLFVIGNDTITYLGTNTESLNTFSNTTLNYTITVPFGLKTINFVANNANGGVVSGTGIYALDADYTKPTILSFFVTSKSGKISETYTVTIEKMAPDSNNDLLSLLINNKPLEGFRADTLSYQLQLNHETNTTIAFAASASSTKAKVSGNIGTFDLLHGKNTYYIYVESEEGIVKTYTVVVDALSSLNALLDLSVKNFSITPAFNANTTNYQLTVPYNQQTIEILASTHPYAKLQGTGLKSLSTGSNVFVVYAVAENGNIGTQYQITVDRSQASSDTTLSNLVVKTAKTGDTIAFSPGFNPTTREYVIQIPSGTSLNMIYIEAIANHKNAIISGDGNRILNALVNGEYHTVIQVLVMAEDGSVGTYTISIYRSVELNKDVTISKLELVSNLGIQYLGTSGALVDFDYLIQNYTIEVPHNVTSITLNIQTLSATIYGTGTKVFGSQTELIFEFYLVSQDGSTESNHYTITVRKQTANADNLLSDLSVDLKTIQGFSPTQYAYELTIPTASKSTLSFGAIANDPAASLSGDLGTKILTEGKNIFHVHVIAQNGTIQTYTIVVNYVQSNALLSSLLVKLSTSTIYDDTNAVILESLTFTPGVTDYLLQVDKSFASARVTGYAQDQAGAQVMGFGNYQIVTDETEIRIFVKSADGSESLMYRVRLVKNAIPSANAQLKSLSIGGYGIAFDQNTYHYQIKLNPKTDSLNMSAETFDPNAKVELLGYTNGNASHQLSTSISNVPSGENTLIIRVTAENGNINYYYLSVAKEAQTDYLLTILLVLTVMMWMVTVVFFLVKQSKSKKKSIYQRNII